MIHIIRWSVFVIGVMFFSFGITVAISVQHLGIHPWDVLNVALFERVGLSIGSWAIIISGLLIIVSWILDKRYIKLGTFFNAFLVGAFVDFFMWLDFLPKATYAWPDILIILTGIVIMGVGGGMYNAAGVGSGPRDGFMLSISDKLGSPIRRVRIITESLILLLGLILGGPVFLFTFIFTFIQSPLFQFSYHKIGGWIDLIEAGLKRQSSKSSA
ncbi:YitT family protein [Virgibacillus sp. NKC19-16]|uniref:YczE/YyaS/YitT family protein n=1 Tax=Virgibacillus salidurans TaxID=2831673 RepID=UPI001F219D5D|nr:YitT family protein [Virgibacillus sp. NKC19-16]UJL47327.1 YitT family protein [Virgibacillus sp. NKC19-16]